MTAFLLSFVLYGVAPAQGQGGEHVKAPQTSDQEQTQPAVPKGEVLFQSHGDPPIAAADVADKAPSPKPTGPELTDKERSAITITGYDLDVRLTPSTSRLGARAKLTLRNDSTESLTRIPLQISSTLQWESANLTIAGDPTKLELGQHLLDTDADHTGRANEVVVVLPSPLEPGGTAVLDLFYSGEIPVSTDRLESIGATQPQALAADWDGVIPEHTALRGFGNVLWYPVASPQVFLGEGAQLFQAIGNTEFREQTTKIRLRIGVEYRGEPPAAVFFCGRRQPLQPVTDNFGSPNSLTTGYATAEFPEEALGFRSPNLFIAERPETRLAPLPFGAGSTKRQALESSSSSSLGTVSTPDGPTPFPRAEALRGSPMLAIEGADRALPDLAKAAEGVAPLVQTWLGEKPLSMLTIFDHAGQPFEDGPLLLAPVSSLDEAGLAQVMVHSLTHAWVQTGQPWMDEGLAQFLMLLLIERDKGRNAEVAQLGDLLQPLAIAEPESEQGKAMPIGQPLTTATSEMFFRRKAAAVWFILRGLAGDQALQSALQAWRSEAPKGATGEQSASAFEALLEQKSGKDLHWFFDDWVLHDRGLPDLTITDVTPHLLPDAEGHKGSWLVSITVHNDGAAAAEVPVVIRSGSYSTTSQLRIMGFSNATARVLVEAAPTEIAVNDGSVPEVRVSRHTRTVVQHQ